MACDLLYPWTAFNHLKAEDFAAALKTIRHLAMGGLRTRDKIPEQLVQVCILRAYLTYFVQGPRALFNAQPPEIAHPYVVLLRKEGVKRLRQMDSADWFRTLVRFLHLQ